MLRRAAGAVQVHHRQQRDQPGQGRFGALVEVGPVGVKAVAAAAGLEVVEARPRVVVAGEPVEEGSGSGRTRLPRRSRDTPGRRLRHSAMASIGCWSKRARLPARSSQPRLPIRLTRLLSTIWTRTSHSSDRSPCWSIAESSGVLAGEDQGVGQLGVVVGEHVLAPGPVGGAVAA